VRHAEALLLVHYQQAQVAELHCRLQHRVRADHHLWVSIITSR
jgi:hypothetical protein